MFSIARDFVYTFRNLISFQMFLRIIDDWHTTISFEIIPEHCFTRSDITDPLLTMVVIENKLYTEYAGHNMELNYSLQDSNTQTWTFSKAWAEASFTQFIFQFTHTHTKKNRQALCGPDKSRDLEMNFRVHHPLHHVQLSMPWTP